MGRPGDPRRSVQDRQPHTDSTARQSPRQQRTRLVAISLIVVLVIGVALTAISGALAA